MAESTFKVARRRKPGIGIDMTPMIDCVFQLLIFFMLSSSMITPQLRLELPSAKTQDGHEEPEIMVSADQDEKLYLYTELVTLDTLPQKLQPLLFESKSKVVTFRGDKKVSYDLLVRTFDVIRSAGSARINLSHQGK